MNTTETTVADKFAVAYHRLDHYLRGIDGDYYGMSPISWRSLKSWLRKRGAEILETPQGQGSCDGTLRIVFGDNSEFLVGNPYQEVYERIL